MRGAQRGGGDGLCVAVRLTVAGVACQPYGRAATVNHAVQHKIGPDPPPPPT